MTPLTLYPEKSTERTRWILKQRGPKTPHAPTLPYGNFLEAEPGHLSQFIYMVYLFFGHLHYILCNEGYF